MNLFEGTRRALACPGDHPPIETAAGDDCGCVEVENEVGLVVAVGRLALTSDTADSRDFNACGVAPAPGGYALRIDGEIAG